MTSPSDVVPQISPSGSPATAHAFQRIVPWLGLLTILVAYAMLVISLQPTNFFGILQDDSIYFTSARALAEGHGYVLPSVPGTPRATKYPFLYPWLLSWIWRWNPSFPANLSYAVALNVVFGFGFLTAAFLFLRKLGGLRDREALLLTAICALHPSVLFFGADPMTEIPFAALSLGAMALAGKAIREERTGPLAVLSGVLSGLAILMRVLGVPVAMGLYVAIVLRKGWRKSVYFAASALPFFTAWLWRALTVPTPQVSFSASSCPDALRTAWLYYTSYLGFWKADALGNHVIWHLLKQNLILLLIQPGSYLVEPMFIHVGLLASVPAAVLSAGAIRGLLVKIDGGKWVPAHFALAFYVLPILLWDYPQVERFVIPFLPFFVAGIWLEAKWLIGRIQLSLRAQGLKKDGFAIVFLSLAIVAMIWSAGLSFQRGFAGVRRRSELRKEILTDKREAYSWLRNNTSADSKMIAYEDASAYLYSNRQAMRPVIFSPAGFYRPGKLRSELSCITAVGEGIGATYWIIADDDFEAEWEPALSRGRERETQLERVLPLAFRSSGGRVRIYGLRGLQAIDGGENFLEYQDYTQPRGSGRDGAEGPTKAP
jgi:hypothetical protein